MPVNTLYFLINLVPRVSPSSRPRKRERGDPGWGWSRVSQRKIRPREGSLACNCPLQKEASALLRATHAKFIFQPSSLPFASYCNINLKAKRVRCIEALYFGKDVVAVLPTGYGKIMIFHLLHSQSYRLAHEVLIVVSYLNALMKDQI